MFTGKGISFTNVSTNYYLLNYLVLLIISFIACTPLLKNIINKINLNNFISYDEMSIYLNSKPERGWSLKGKECIIKTKNKTKTIFNKRFSLGMSIDINSNIDFTIKEKALDSFKFNKFINKINKKNNKIIFLDNASIHNNFVFKNNIVKNNWNIIYNIPYHSHLNPIEYVFSLLRKKINNDNVETYEQLIKTIIHFIKNINKIHIKNIFFKCLNEIKCRENQYNLIIDKIGIELKNYIIVV